MHNINLVAGGLERNPENSGYKAKDTLALVPNHYMAQAHTHTSIYPVYNKTKFRNTSEPTLYAFGLWEETHPAQALHAKFMCTEQSQSHDSNP